MAVEHSTPLQVRENRVIYRALKLLEDRMKAVGDALTSTNSVRDYLRLLLGGEDREVFAVVFLDSQHRVIASEKMFYGSLYHTAIYPREVARRALHHNAAAVILAHNHPSGAPMPSRHDLVLTCGLMDTLRLFDVRVNDHFIVTGDGATSLFELGLLGLSDFPLPKSAGPSVTPRKNEAGKPRQKSKPVMPRPRIAKSVRAADAAKRDKAFQRFMREVAK